MSATTSRGVVRERGALRECSPLVGLTATPYRRDGLEAIMSMHLGPKRLVIGNAENATASLPRRLVVHETLSDPAVDDEGRIHDVFRAIVDDDERTAIICADVRAAVEKGRRCIVLTQWSDHVARIGDYLTASGVDPIVMTGAMGKKARAAVLAQLDDPNAAGQLVVATGSYIGEGFDCPTLDTLFLAFPLAFKGRVVQYIGRILRTNEGKADIEVHDYLDPGPIFRKMHSKRLATYRTLGFDTPNR